MKVDRLIAESCCSEARGKTTLQQINVTVCKKVQVGKDQEKAQSEKDSYSKK